MRHPTPVLALLRKVQKRNREQRERLLDQARYIESLEHRVEVQTRRADRWRRTAMELAPKVGPRAMDICLMQAQSDELADLPETRRHERRVG